jgi:hypothetical protein
MKNKKQIVLIILWFARIWGVLSLAFMLLFVGAHVYASLTEKGETLGQPDISFLFFPVSIIIGLAIALKWEGLGGFITISGIIGFHFIRPDLIFDIMIDGLAAPGLLYVLYWSLSGNLNNATLPTNSESINNHQTQKENEK